MVTPIALVVLLIMQILGSGTAVAESKAAYESTSLVIVDNPLMHHLEYRKAATQALFTAVAAGDTHRVENALFREADVNATNDQGATPLIEAVFSGDLTIVRLLAAAPGINPNIKDHRRTNALSYAREMIALSKMSSRPREQTDLVVAAFSANRPILASVANDISALLGESFSTYQVAQLAVYGRDSPLGSRICRQGKDGYDLLRKYNFLAPTHKY